MFRKKLMSIFQELVEKINFLVNKKNSILIAIDGLGGSGKTTIAKKLKDKFPKVVIVEMDDFYSPEIKKADHKRLLEQVINPLKNNQIAQYQVFDWKNNKLINTDPILPDSMVIIEGVFSLHEELIDNYDIKIWVEYPQQLGIERGVKRDGEEYRNKWENEWGPMEKNYKETQKPDQKADFIIDGTSL